MNRIAFGKCNYCGQTFSVVEWYDFMNNEGLQTETPWNCPGCKQKLRTDQILISYEYEEE